MIEVELKSILSLQARARLKRELTGFTQQERVHNLDIYYDTPGFTLFQRAVFVRMRNNTHVQFKFNRTGERAHVQSIEHTFPVQPTAEQAKDMNTMFAYFLPQWKAAPDMAQAIESNDLIELARIDNVREIYTDGTITVSLDAVAGLGEFVELEAHCEEGTETHQILRRLHDFLDKIDLQHLRLGYVELWLHRYRPAVYRLGRYQV